MPVDARLAPDDPWADEAGFEAPQGPREPTAEFSVPDLPGLRLKQFLARELLNMAADAASRATATPTTKKPRVRPRGLWRAAGVFDDEGH